MQNLQSVPAPVWLADVLHFIIVQCWVFLCINMLLKNVAHHWPPGARESGPI